MPGPSSWRPPYYSFDEQFPADHGSCAEQGDNEPIPPYERLKKFVPADNTVADQRIPVLPRL